MKIVFIQPKSFFTWESLNIGYLSSFIKTVTNADIKFYSEFFDTEKEIIAGCRDADIIGISATSPQYAAGLRIADLVKRKNNWTVMGGYHVTNIQKCEKPLDAVVIGAGEMGMLSIVNGDRRNVILSDRVLINNIPWPDREVIRQKENIDRVEKNFGKRIIAMLGNRGCPYRCSFCSSHSVHKKPEIRDPADMFAEFDFISKEYKADFVTFSDDELGTWRRQMMEFCRIKINSSNRTPWGCNAVVKDMDAELLKAMKAAGCAELWFGVESGDDDMLREMRKPYTTEHVIKTFKLTEKIGIKRRAYCILGMPNESYETIKKTEKLIDKIKPDVVGFTIVAPYPGNKFYKKKYEKIDWSQVDEYGNDFTRTRYLSNQQLKAEQKRLVDKYKKALAYRNKK